LAPDEEWFKIGSTTKREAPMPQTDVLHFAVDDVVKDIAGKIDGGVWENGDRLPPERILASQYGLARNTVRRALKVLEDDGRLARRTGRGTFVQSAHAQAVGDLARRMQDASPEDVMEVRLIIEPEAAALATSRATAAELREIELILRSSLSAKGVAEFEIWDAKLHLAIFRAARNVLLLDYCKAINAARNHPRWYKMKQRTATPQRRAIYHRQHTDLVNALSERDAEAARAAAHLHLVTVRDNLLGLQR
jgi:DNA-binding FadR family transcriptional regulator